jgi:hypothetical protein
MTQIQLTVYVKVAWWVRPLLWSWARFYAVTGISPDLERLERLILRGVRPVVLK